MAHKGDDEQVDGNQAQRRAVRDGYDALADDYRKSRDPPETALVESFLADLPDGSRLLDVGCGQGTPVLDRLPAGVDAVGLDFAAEQLRYAREATDGALVRADMTVLPVADASVDALTVLHSLIHVPVRRHPTVLAEFARVARPGARLLLTAGQDAWAGANDDWLESGVRMEWSFPGVEATCESLRQTGFAVTDERFVRDELAEEDDDVGWLFLTAERVVD